MIGITFVTIFYFMATFFSIEPGFGKKYVENYSLKDIDHISSNMSLFEASYASPKLKHNP